MNEAEITLALVSLVIIILNLPFGYWRAHVIKFSLQWILAVHVPVPIVVILRIYSGIGFEFITYPVIVATFFLGQYLGKKFYEFRKTRVPFQLTACLIYDLYRKS